MALTDKPTDKQIELLFRWFRWNMSRPQACHALDWLQDNSTRGDVSKEIARVHDLYHAHNLSLDNCFDSPIWADYRPKAQEGGECDN